MDMNKTAYEVSLLTPDQKRNMGTIYKKYIKSLVAIVLISVIVTAGLFVFFNTQAKKSL